MTAPRRTLQERLRDNRGQLRIGGCQGCFSSVMDEAADVLEAQSQLLAEAREALEPFAKAADAVEDWVKARIAPESPDWVLTGNDLRNARAVLAKLKAASGEE